MTPDGLELRLPAEAANVAVVRHAVAGLAEAIGMEPAAVADLKTVVSEACMNVVSHAYEPDDSPGLLAVEAHPEDEALVVVVRDEGAGIRPRVDPNHQSLRLGLPLIAALSDGFAISGAPGRGTEVTIRMALVRAPEPAAPAEPREPVPAATEMRRPAGALLGPVVSRVISILAARADLSVDRLSDAVLLGDAISARAPGEFTNGMARIEGTESDGELRLRVGPLVEGAGERMLSAMRIPEIGGSLERLADEIRVERERGHESILVRIGRKP